ncbi:MAG: hypothetical protein LCH37_14845 [Bacteroidetes bacterium]|nr:hypothetical protein [Bacteroidota bacterium]
MENKAEFIRLRTGITSADFDQDGLRWPTFTLELVRGEILFWPMLEAAKFVDRVVFEIVSKSDQTELSILMANLKRNRPTLESANTTSIGNLAFVATFSGVPELSALAYKQLLELRAEAFKAHSFPTVSKSKTLAEA